MDYLLVSLLIILIPTPAQADQPIQAPVQIPIQIPTPILEVQECSCVPFVRSYIPELPRGDAIDLVPNATLEDAEVVIFNYGGVGHLAVKLGLQGGMLDIIEKNKIKCQITERTIPVDDPAIVGGWRS